MSLFRLPGEKRLHESEPNAEDSDRARTLWGSLQRDAVSQDLQRSNQQLTNPPDSLRGSLREDDIPQIFLDREEVSEASGARWSNDPSVVEAKAQQIILTERQATDSGESALSGSTWQAEPDEQLMTVASALESPSLRGGSGDKMAAPEPADARIHEGAFVTVQDIVGGAGEDVTEPRSGFMASVFDVFGVGGEHESADRDELSVDSIQPPGLQEESTSPSKESGETSPATLLDFQSTDSLRSVYWQEELDKLIALLETQVAQQTPGESVPQQDLYVRQHVALRMLYLIASRRPEALSAIPDVPEDEQEFWTQIFWALSSTFDDEAMPNRGVRAAQTVSQLRAAVLQRALQAPLQLQHTLFCQRIDGFGDYVPFPEDRFEAGQQVLIYTEVKNQLSEPTGEGDFRTVLKSTITIRQDDVNGRTMFKQDLPQTEDRCRSRRSDYFHSYRIPLADTLQPGPHVLILQVTDILSGRTGQTTMNFVVR